MEAISIATIILFSCAVFDHSLAGRNEPACYSTFDFHEKVLEKQVRTEYNMELWEERINSMADRFREEKASMQTMVETFKSDMNHMTETLAKMEEKQDEMTRAAVERGIRMSQELNNTLETAMKDVKNRSATPPSAFMAHGVHITNPTIGEPIIFTNVLLNMGEVYDPTTGIFTAHIPGVYQFSVQIYVAPSNKHIYVQIRKNSATVVGSFYKCTTQVVESFTGFAVVQLEAGDTVSIVRISGSSDAIFVSDSNLWESFSGTLVTVIP